MAAFLSGIVVGGIMGIVILSLCQAASWADRDLPKN